MAKKNSQKLPSSAFDSIQATDFALVNAEGHICARLMSDPRTNLPLLRFFDTKGNEQLQIGAGNKGAGIVLLKGDGGVGIGIGADQDGAFEINIYHADGNLAFHVKVFLSGAIDCSVFDKDGNNIWNLDKK